MAALRAAGALGVGTEADIRDYFRLSAQQVKPAIADLLAANQPTLAVCLGLPALKRYHILHRFAHPH